MLAALNPSNATVAISKEKIAAENATGRVNLAKLNQEREQLLQQKGDIQQQSSREFLLRKARLLIDV